MVAHNALVLAVGFALSSCSMVLGACVPRGSVDKQVLMVNLKTMKTDGTAVAFIEDGSCPVPIPSGNALFEEDNHHHQLYSDLKLNDGSVCQVEGWDNNATTMMCTKAGVEDTNQRKWVDAVYKAQACPPGCDAQCKAIDPDWNANALKMFAFEWTEAGKGPTSTRPRETVTATVTVKARRGRRQPVTAV